MKKRTMQVLLFCGLCLLLSCASHNGTLKPKSDYKCSLDEKGKPVVAGPVSWDEWTRLAAWHSYESAPGAFDILKAKLAAKTLNSDDYILMIFAGSWCEDSETQVPILMDMFKNTGIDSNRIYFYGVDRNKLEGSGTAAKYKIAKVPTLIILKSGKEIGRIEELPKVSWEDDIRNIVFKNK